MKNQKEKPRLRLRQKQVQKRKIQALHQPLRGGGVNSSTQSAEDKKSEEALAKRKEEEKKLAEKRRQEAEEKKKKEAQRRQETSDSYRVLATSPFAGGLEQSERLDQNDKEEVDDNISQSPEMQRIRQDLEAKRSLQRAKSKAQRLEGKIEDVKEIVRKWEYYKAHGNKIFETEGFSDRFFAYRNKTLPRYIHDLIKQLEEMNVGSVDYMNLDDVQRMVESLESELDATRKEIETIEKTITDDKEQNNATTQPSDEAT